MKTYIIDKGILLLFIIADMLILPRLCGYNMILTMILELMVGYFGGYLCKPLLLLPFDLMVSKKEEELYFSRMCNIDNYELFQDQYYCEWRFYSSKGTVKVLVPASLSLDEIRNMDRPKADQKVKVCYYPYSKILCSWELV